jgi:hypothetical protein
MATEGIDIASIDGNGTPDWNAAVTQAHLRFVGLRAVYGMTVDPWYATYVNQLDARGIPHFPYLLLIPNLSTPEDQAKKALDVIGTLNNHYFPLALDVEGDRRGLSAPEWLDWVTRAKRTIEAAIGVPPLLYTSYVYWVDPVGMDNLPAPELADCCPWVKYWPFPTDSQAVYDPAVIDALPSPPCPPPFGNCWIIQQTQGDAIRYPGFKSTVDINRLHVQKQGDHDDSVKWIQRRLPGLVVDGIYGPMTTGAVKTFQTQKKITADGIVGLDTTQLLSWVPPRSTTTTTDTSAPSGGGPFRS